MHYLSSPFLRNVFLDLFQDLARAITRDGSEYTLPEPIATDGQEEQGCSGLIVCAFQDGSWMPVEAARLFELPSGLDCEDVEEWVRQNWNGGKQCS